MLCDFFLSRGRGMFLGLGWKVRGGWGEGDGL